MRLYYLDFMRGLAVFFMVMQHAVILYEQTAGEGDSILANIFLLLGTAPAAPVFMIIMGIFIMHSNKPLKQNIVRGLKLFTAGYLLNLLRFVLPQIIYLFINDKPVELTRTFLLFQAVDILQLAGLSYIICSLVKQFIKSKIVIFLLALLILLVSPYLWGICSNNQMLFPFTGLDKVVYFPLFPWLYYPLLGMVIHKIIFNLEKNNKYLFVFAAIFLALAYVTYDVFPVGDYYRSGAAIHFLMSGIVFLWFIIADIVVNKIFSKYTFSTLNFWSENITLIYFVQWIFFGWSIFFLENNSYDDMSALAIGLCVMFLTHLLIKIKKYNDKI